MIVVFVVLCAWTLGFVSHRIFKKTQSPPPLMKVHRVIGPLAIALGIANGIVGFTWIGRNTTAITYSLFNVLIALVIGSLLFWKRKRDLKKGAMNSAAATNFREGNSEAGFGHGPAMYYGGPPAHGQPGLQQPGVQMQTFYPK